MHGTAAFFVNLCRTSVGPLSVDNCRTCRTYVGLMSDLCRNTLSDCRAGAQFKTTKVMLHPSKAFQPPSTCRCSAGAMGLRACMRPQIVRGGEGYQKNPGVLSVLRRVGHVYISETSSRSMPCAQAWRPTRGGTPLPCVTQVRGGAGVRRGGIRLKSVLQVLGGGFQPP